MTAGAPEPDLADLLELGAVALQGLLRPLALRSAAPVATSPGRTRPVIFVHGWGGSRAGWLPLIGFLSLRGFDRLFACDPDAQAAFQIQARTLAEQVEALADVCRIGKGSVDLVAHGTGGLVARLYVQSHGGSRRVDRLITLATPHQGTLSPFWAATPLAERLLPNSEFITGLNAGAAQAPVRHLSFWSDRDVLIAPSQNAINPQGEEVHLAGVGHQGLLFHPQAMRQIALRLGTGQDLPRGRLGRARRLAGRLIERLGKRQANSSAQKVPSR